MPISLFLEAKPTALALRTRLTGVVRGYTGGPRGRDAIPGPGRGAGSIIVGCSPGCRPFAVLALLACLPGRGPTRPAGGARRHSQAPPAAPPPPERTGAAVPGDLGLGGTGGPRGRGVTRHFHSSFLWFQCAHKTPSPFPRPSTDLGRLIGTRTGVVGLCIPPGAAV